MSIASLSNEFFLIYIFDHHGVRRVSVAGKIHVRQIGALLLLDLRLRFFAAFYEQARAQMLLTVVDSFLRRLV